MQVIPLGTNGFFPSFGRQTMCFAIPLGKTLIILDAGSGLFRFAEPIGKKLLDGVDTIHLYLSHYHLDHTFGFYAAWKLFAGKKVTVFGKSTKRVFKELYSHGYIPGLFEKQYSSFCWEEVGEKVIARDVYQMKARKQLHNGAGSLAYRFQFQDASLAYVTDSEPTRESIEFVRGVNLLLHEHYLGGEEASKRKNISLEDHYLAGHVTTVGAATIAKEAQVGKLALIHNYPFADEKQLKRLETLSESIFSQSTCTFDCIPNQF